MKTTTEQYLLKQRLLLDKLAKKMNCSFYPVMKKTAFAGYMLGNKKSVPTEAKIRNCTFGTYESTLVEKKKMDRLYNAYKRNQHSGAYYIEFFTDNYAILFDLTETMFEWCHQDCNINTTVSSKKQDKLVSFLSYNKGTIINLNVPTEQEFKISTQTFTETMDGKIELKVTPLF